jgi:hypothetical protein
VVLGEVTEARLHTIAARRRCTRISAGTNVSWLQSRPDRSDPIWERGVGPTRRRARALAPRSPLAHEAARDVQVVPRGPSASRTTGCSHRLGELIADVTGWS